MPNHAAWPKLTRPVKPIRRLRPSTAIQRMTTIVAVVSVSPIAGSTKGSRHSTIAPMSRVCVFEFIGSSALEFRHAFAKQAAGAQKQYEEHQNVHRRLGRS